MPAKQPDNLATKGDVELLKKDLKETLATKQELHTFKGENFTRLDNILHIVQRVDQEVKFLLNY